MAKKTLSHFASERLAELDGELMRLRARIAAIENEYQFLNAALKGEVPQSPYKEAPSVPQTQPEIASRIVCGSGHGWEARDVIEAARRRYGVEIPARSLNTILNRLRSDAVLERRSDGKWYEAFSGKITVHSGP